LLSAAPPPTLPKNGNRHNIEGEEMAAFNAGASRLLSALAALCLSAAPLRAADQSVIDAAKKEGKVVWYTTLIVNQVVLPLKAAFEKKYPGVTLEYSRNDEGPTAIRLLNEAKSGRMQADVFDGLTVNVPLKREGLLARIDVPNAADYPTEMKDQDGTWHALLLFVFTPGFNTNLVSKAEAPKTYKDLLDPKWKGKMAWNPNSSAGALGFVGNILTSMGQEAGMAYLRELAKQQIVNVEASSRAILDQVIAGEYPIGLMMFNNHTVISARKGAPSDWLPMEPVPVAFDSLGILKNGPHPNAAKLLVEFLLSEEGQQVLKEADYLPALPKVPAMKPGMRPEDGGFKATWLRPDIVDPQMPTWSRVAKELFR
jgi:iron(III) transport system substrate-binding protein